MTDNDQVERIDDKAGPCLVLMETNRGKEHTSVLLKGMNGRTVKIKGEAVIAFIPYLLRQL